MKLASILLLCLFAITGHATKPSDHGFGTNNLSTSSGVSNSGNSLNHLEQGQNLIGSGNSENHNGQAQVQGQSANNNGNAQNVNFNQMKQHHNTPNLGALFAYPTAPCALPVGGMGAGAGFGFGFNTAYINEECVKSETAKLAMALSEPLAAKEVFCSMEHAQGTTICKDMKRSIKPSNESVGESKHIPVSNVIEDGKRGIFGMKWDATQQQWVF